MTIEQNSSRTLVTLDTAREVEALLAAWETTPAVSKCACGRGMEQFAGSPCDHCLAEIYECDKQKLADDIDKEAFWMAYECRQYGGSANPDDYMDAAARKLGVC